MKHNKKPKSIPAGIMYTSNINVIKVKHLGIMNNHFDIYEILQYMFHIQCMLRRIKENEVYT